MIAELEAQRPAQAAPQQTAVLDPRIAEELAITKQELAILYETDRASLTALTDSSNLRYDHRIAFMVSKVNLHLKCVIMSIGIC